jgi:Flp pilus assembly protein TadG
LPALLVLLLVGLTAVGAVTTKLQCVDAAREAALAAARGEPGTAAGLRAAPEAAEVSVTVDGDTVIATVRAPVPLLGARLPGRWVEASAVAAVEPGSPAPAR